MESRMGLPSYRNRPIANLMPLVFPRQGGGDDGSFLGQTCCVKRRAEARRQGRSPAPRDYWGRANTTSVEPMRHCCPGKSAAVAPPISVPCHPVGVAMYWRPFTE